MKNIIIPTVFLITLSVVLTSCGSPEDTKEHVKTENFVMYTDAEYPEVALETQTTQTESADTKNFTYALNGTRVELLINGETVKYLDYYYTPDVNEISVADFDFDGYEDIFIPYESPSDYGTYYSYIPAENSFSENAELNSVGRIMTVNDDNTLIEDRSDETTKRTIEYQWINQKLRAVKKTETYRSSESGELLTDMYNYDENGIEYLVSTTGNEATDAVVGD